MVEEEKEVLNNRCAPSTALVILTCLPWLELFTAALQRYSDGKLPASVQSYEELASSTGLTYQCWP